MEEWNNEKDGIMECWNDGILEGQKNGTLEY
jgi:hypothetical protein